MPAPRPLLKAWRAANRAWLVARGQPPVTAHFDHPFSGGFFDAALKLRGWVSSSRPVRSVAIIAPGMAENTHLVRREDVEEVMAGRYRHHTGFESVSPAMRLIGDGDRAEGHLAVVTDDGHRHEQPFELMTWRVQKLAKFHRFRPLLACPACQGKLVDAAAALRCPACAVDYPVTPNSVGFLTQAMERKYDIEATDNVSAWEYDPKIMEIVGQYPGGLFLDCGAGLRRKFLSNVINLEIVDYSSTDVLGVGEHLPFSADSFEGVVSVGVLEHVKDPFRCAREITRVLKPGGALFCAVPFIQPLHAYPHHYYNMTAQGLANLFPDLDIREQFVPPTLHPLKAVQWVVYEYARGLAQPQQRQFVNMRIQELIDLPLMPAPAADQPFVTALHPDKLNELASGTCLVAVKR